MSWDNWVLANELGLRLGFFFGVFVLVALWEILLPSSSPEYSENNALDE